MLHTWTTKRAEICYTFVEDTIEIETFALDEIYRGKGFAKQEMLDFVKYTQQYDFTAVRLSAFDSRDSKSEAGLSQYYLEEFYKKLGFTIYDYVNIEGIETPRFVMLKSEWNSLIEENENV
ncbi:hypothetical protein SM033_00019 [Vibrio phage vB_VpaM_sm033]|nr:hypothetical protein SM033_00019 [Vibrio phage vB_VpaM_sm033]